MRIEMSIMRMIVMMGTVMARINSRVPLSSGSDKNVIVRNYSFKKT
jgi:hypothetical protein